jgi:hypothetical protein
VTNGGFVVAVILFMKKTVWKTAPISPTCEFMLSKFGDSVQFCDAAADIAYPAMGGGWMALCFKHGRKHLPHASRIDALIEIGETWK